MTLKSIREKFLAFFEGKKHQRLPSSSLVPAGDPTLLFTNSGMVQFKDVFLGFEKRPCKTAVTAQRCLRVGGKHNDLQNVGYTSRHHTFFEMLGNFSFGDYFKEKAIPLAWEFLTSPGVGLGIPKEHLWITVFGGGNIFGGNEAAAPADNDAHAIWKQTLQDAGFGEKEAEKRIIRIRTADNFWMMGDTGPCGPCSEIFYDPDGKAEKFRGDNPDYADKCIEVWNLVFMEFNRDGGALKPLPAPCVDTGMGLERIAAVMKGASSNYDINLFCDLICEFKEVTKTKSLATTASHRVVADHIRAAAFLIADGVLPDNEGRGYVLRKIIRRALMHGAKAANKPNLGIHTDGWMHLLVGKIAEVMGRNDSCTSTVNKDNSLPGDYIHEKREEIKEVLQREEKAFGKNFLSGRAHLIMEIKRVKDSLQTVTSAPNGLETIDSPFQRGEKVQFPGDIAFELYDTFGFPVEATLDEVVAAHFSGIDMQAFDECMNQQRARSRGAMKFDAGQKTADYDGAASEFVGYDSLQCEAKILALFVGGERVKEARPGQEAVLVLDRTPFYAEAGGQVGDSGALKKNGATAAVADCKKIRADAAGHFAALQGGAMAEGDSVLCEVDAQRRRAIVCNHSATHLMHAALQKVVGAHVRQKGALVAPDHLRFDFSHHAPLSAEQIREVENIVNEQIRANYETITELTSFDEAIRRGAMALFGEKYGDTVRLVSINSEFSMELCGGTHVGRGGDIGLFRCLGESGIAAGVRRIEGITAAAALSQAQNDSARLSDIAAALKSPREHVLQKIEQMRLSVKEAQKQIAALQDAQTESQVWSLAERAENIGGKTMLLQKMDGAEMKTLQDALRRLQARLPQAAILLAGDGGGRASFVASSAFSDSLSAKEWMDKAAAVCGAKGGGKKDRAQCGGGDASKIDSALQAAREFAAHVAE